MLCTFFGYSSPDRVFLEDDKRLAVFAPPFHRRFWLTRGPADQRGVLSFGHCDIRTGLLRPDVRRYQDADAAYLHLHHGRVNLTHVTAFVLFPNAGDAQGPSALLVVSHLDPRVVRYDFLMQSEDGLIARLDPPDLQIYK